MVSKIKQLSCAGIKNGIKKILVPASSFQNRRFFDTNEKK
jgi:hypothetical protein